MFWRLFVKDLPLLDSALEGIVFKEGKGRLYGRFRKKRLLSYDEVTKCLRYYTPQRSLKGTIHLHDILFITPGRSSGRDVRKDSVFEITVPGRVYVFHVNNIRETKKWIGILSRELDNLKIRDRIQLNNGNLIEGTYSKTLSPNSTILGSLRIGDHREHEECCFLFDEEHQHKIIALESLCSLQAMKIYELSHSVEKFQRKVEDLEAPPNEEIQRLKEQYHRLRVVFEKDKLQVLDLKAKLEEKEEQKAKEQDQQQVRKVEKHQHTDLVSSVKVMQVERTESPRLITNQKKNIPTSPSFVNMPNSDKSRMEEIKKLQEELEHTKALLARERVRVLENPFQALNFNSPSHSPLLFDPRNNTTTTTTTTSPLVSHISSPNRSPTSSSRSSTPSNSTNSSLRLQTIPENTAFNNSKPSSNSYQTFSPAALTSAYLGHFNSQLEPSPKKPLRTNPPTSPKLLRSPPTAQPSQQNGNENLQIISPQPRYPTQTLLLSDPLPLLSPQASNSSEQHISLASNTQTNPSLDLASNNTRKQQNGQEDSNGISSQVLGDFNLVSFSNTNTPATGDDDKPRKLSNSGGISQDFNTVIRDVQTKPRSYSESGPSAPYANFKSPNGKLPSDKSMVEIISSRSRTNSYPVPFNYGQSSGATSVTLSSKFGSEFAEMLTSHPDDNGWAVQVVAKLNETIAEITSLSTQLQVEREKVKSLMEEKAHMLDTMEDMTAEKARTQKFKDEMEDLMETTEGKLNAMREALEIEIQLRLVAEAKLNQIAQARSSLQGAILDDEMPAKTDILQPLITNYSH